MLRKDQEIALSGVRTPRNTVSDTFLLPVELLPATYVFQDTFVDLVAVRWEQFPQFHQFDNLVVVSTPVPEPANLLLLLVGSVTLLWVIRRAD